MGLRAGKLSSADEVQVSLFDNENERERRERLETAIDSVRERFGKSSVSRALTIHPKKENE